MNYLAQKKIKVLSRFLILIVSFSLISATSLCAASVPSEGQAILSAAEVNYPPFCIENDKNQADGFAVELLRESLAAMGKDVSFTVGPWAEVKQSLIDRNVQVLPLVGRTPEREEDFDFTFPYIKLHGTIVVRNDSTDINSIKDLQNKRIAVMKGDNAEEFVRRENLSQSILTSETFDDALFGLSQGEYDAVIIQKLLAAQLIREHEFKNLKIVGKPLQGFVQSFCFAVAKGDKQLLSVLNEGLSIVIADGTYHELYEKWFVALKSPQKSRLVMGGDFNYPPYEFLDENGQPAGYNVDLSKAIAKSIGLEIDIQLGAWGDIRKKLQANQIDMVQGMFYSDNRDKFFDFSSAHTLVNHVAFSRIDAPFVQSMTDLAGKNIIVMNGDIMHDIAMKAGYLKQIVLVETQQKALQLLAQGTADYALLAKIPALYWISKEKITNLQISSNTLLSSPYCYAALQGNNEFVKKFSVALSDLEAEGVRRKIYQKWFSQYDEQWLSQKEVLKYSLYALGPIVFFVLLAFFWSWSLKRQVMQKTVELKEETDERKRIEVQLQNKQKFEAIGQLAGGIAHDFNNILTVIFGYSELILRRTHGEDRVHKDVEIIIDAAKKAQNITGQLMAFSRKQVLSPEALDLNIFVGNFKKFLLRLVKENIQIIVEEHPSPLTVKIDPAQIEQVLINLIVNARDAIGSHPGTIMISIEEGAGDRLIHDEGTNIIGSGYALITVEDTGPGIPLDIKDKIFDPFYTTKKQGEGTGLGLSTVYGIVKQSGGYIFVDSEVGHGAKFSVFLPKTDEKPGLVRKKPETHNEITSKTILIVDDEYSILSIMSQLLKVKGFNVLSALNAEDALRHFEKSTAIDMLITDIGMPDIGGIELAIKALEIRNSLKVLFISGYGDFHDCTVDERVASLPFLQKPFTSADLINKINNVFLASGVEVAEKSSLGDEVVES